MDSVYVVNNYLQSGDSGIFKDILYFIPLILTAALVYFAWRMKGLTEASGRNAEAILKNAAAMKELEKTNHKIAMWPEVKKLIQATDEFIWEVSETFDEDAVLRTREYSKKIRFIHYFIGEKDEIFKSIQNLVLISHNLNRYHSLQKTEDNEEEKQQIREKFNAELKLFYKKAHEISSSFLRRFGLNISNLNTD